MLTYCWHMILESDIAKGGSMLPILQAFSTGSTRASNYVSECHSSVIQVHDGILPVAHVCWYYGVFWAILSTFQNLLWVEQEIKEEQEIL